MTLRRKSRRIADADADAKQRQILVGAEGQLLDVAAAAKSRWPCRDAAICYRLSPPASRTTPSVPLDPQKFVRRMLTLRGVHNYQPRHLRMALDFLAGEGQGYPFDSLIAASYPLDQVEDAFAAAGANPGRRVAVIASE